MAPTGLLLTSERSIDFKSLNELLTSTGINPDTVTIATSSGPTTAQLPASTYETIISLGGATSGHHSVDFLGRLSAALQPAGKLIIKESDTETLRKNLLLSGFTETTATSSDTLTAKKPNWETGTKAAISLKPRSAAAAGAWTVSPDDGDEELVDAEALLTEDDLKRPQVNKENGGDCGASGRKACANCSCGRADGTAKEVKLTKEMLENPQPSGGCGSCSLGDAFRCAGCPYKGLPAFEPGKPIKVSADFLVADA